MDIVQPGSLVGQPRMEAADLPLRHLLLPQAGVVGCRRDGGSSGIRIAARLKYD